MTHSERPWRVILTDSEDLTGVAPVCPRQAEPGGPHDIEGPGEDDLSFRYQAAGVYDCCPEPHLETYSTVKAAEVAEVLTRLAVGVCS
jgi:hypothetical protein